MQFELGRVSEAVADIWNEICPTVLEINRQIRLVSDISEEELLFIKDVAIAFIFIAFLPVRNSQSDMVSMEYLGVSASALVPENSFVGSLEIHGPLDSQWLSPCPHFFCDGSWT